MDTENNIDADNNVNVDNDMNAGNGMDIGNDMNAENGMDTDNIIGTGSTMNTNNNTQVPSFGKGFSGQEQLGGTEEVATSKEEFTPEFNNNGIIAAKKKRRLIIGAIVALVVLIGGGIFAAFAIINNSPNNVVMSAFDNLLKAERVTVDGDIEIAPEFAKVMGVESVNVNFDSKMVGAGQSANASLIINFADGNTSQAMNFGQVMVSNGVFYLKVDGLEDFYQKNLRDMILMNLGSYVGTQYQFGGVVDCADDGDEYVDCSSMVQDTSTYNLAVNQSMEKIMELIDSTIASIDGQWYKISAEEIINSDFMIEQMGMSVVARQEAISVYNCSMGVVGRFSSDYAKEFSELYGKYPFLKLDSGQDGFYDVSFDADRLADYLNGSNQTKFYKDLKVCIGNDVVATGRETTTQDVETLLEDMPDFSMKFDGLFDHHLTDVKISQLNYSGRINAKMKFGYPSQLDIEVPTDSRPIMELVEEVYGKIMQLYGLFEG